LSWIALAAAILAAAPREAAPASPFELVFEWTVSGNQDLYVVGAQGGPPRRLTTDPHVDALPRWSADGATVFFTSDRSGNWQVYSVPAAGGAARRIRDNRDRST
jgi:TolB protein